ncbi:AAA family ATPase [Streptomyces sp. SID3343]|uniref:McrB family protein n=1 Tax=Streptomyces sp. SID3343 TaxID=2690260 RepID=UPI00136C5C7E|nr:AAA family ATPase [Streptomyces sp. SID3343]MYW06467.1 AAA domain-containing protein [Streptomyces sp. SID3343]
MTTPDHFRSAALKYDRSGPVAQLVAEAAEQRKHVQTAFLLDDWPSLPLERYALGQEHSDPDDPPYCKLIEFRTPALGSMKGGSSAKHILYRHHSGVWKTAKPLRDLPIEDAWARLRGEFVAGLKAAGAGAFDRIDSLPILQYGPALVTKTLTTYFPDEFLPIYSAAHLRYFIELVGGTPAPGAATWRLNRHLRTLLRSRDEIAGWQPDEVSLFLYDTFDPRPVIPDMVQISPETPDRWEDCLADGSIRIGWDRIDDLGQYPNDEELRLALVDAYPRQAAQSVRLAESLRCFRDLQPGALVFANEGTSDLLAVGTVTDGYSYDETRSRGRHRVAVRWDVGYAQHFDTPQRGWGGQFTKVSQRLWQDIQSRRQAAKTGEEATAQAAAGVGGPTPELPLEVSRVLKALQRKGQVILQGPPGTGKTHLALNAALALNGHADAVTAAPTERAQAIRSLLDGDRVELVTFHPTYDYGDFVQAFKPVHEAGQTGGLALKKIDGLFHRICTKAAEDDEHTYLVVIDEINRGDLPRILGELVTLLDLDKRGLPVTLPLTGESFSVPPNVRIIGTMNIVDHNVAGVDRAIMRRFARVDMPPDSSVIAASIGGLALGDLLDALNTRIARALGRTCSLIGHSYLMRDGQPLATDDELSDVYFDEIIPDLEQLLSFEGNVTIGEVLGSLMDYGTNRPRRMAPSDLVGALADWCAATESGPPMSPDE